jgi:hypothetical protein
MTDTLAASAAFRPIRGEPPAADAARVGIPMLKMMGVPPGAAGDRHDHRASAGHTP